jgi:hypothetical protein
VFNIYTELYNVLGTQPTDDAGRTKPPCCDQINQLPPVLGAEIADILGNANQIRRTRRR